MKRCLAYLLLLGLAGCLSVRRSVSREDVVGTWQHENTGLSSIQTLLFENDGVFSCDSGHAPVGMVMTGVWKLKSDRLWLYPDELKVRGGPALPLPEKYWRQGKPSRPLQLKDGKLVLQFEDDKPFKKKPLGTDPLRTSVKSERRVLAR
jgi:hypothetical protein